MTGGQSEYDLRAIFRDFRPIGTRVGFDAKGAEARYGREMEIYLEMGERWRILSKLNVRHGESGCCARRTGGGDARARRRDRDQAQLRAEGHQAGWWRAKGRRRRMSIGGARATHGLRLRVRRAGHAVSISLAI